jgi:hypothetical protein
MTNPIHLTFELYSPTMCRLVHSVVYKTFIKVSTNTYPIEPLNLAAMNLTRIFPAATRMVVFERVACATSFRSRKRYIQYLRTNSIRLRVDCYINQKRLELQPEVLSLVLFSRPQIAWAIFSRM